MDFLQPIVNEDISLFSYFPYGAFSLLTCHIWNEMSLQIRFYFPTNYIKVEFFYRFFPTHLESIYLFYFFNLLFYFIFFFLIIFFSFSDYRPGYIFQNGEQISFFWVFFCSDLCENFVVLKA